MARRRKLFLLALVLALGTCVASWFLLRQRKADVARRELAAIIPQIVSITLYDLDAVESQTAESLSGVIAAPFPVEVFVRAASSADHHGGVAILMGSSLAVLTLRDGSQRRARFSYYGGFFTLEGTSGRFVIPGASSSDFHKRYHHFVQEQFVPERRRRLEESPPPTKSAKL